jgi:hypothetical protein
MHREIKQAVIGVLLAGMVIATAALLLFTLAVQPQLRTVRTLRLLHDLEKAVVAYWSDHGTLPRSETELLAALRGENPETTYYLAADIEARIRGGVPHDFFESPLRYRQSQPLPQFISAGPDREQGTDDDLTTQTITALLRTHEHSPGR